MIGDVERSDFPLPAARPSKMSPASATRKIRTRARVSANVVLTFRAQEQMVAREIFAADVFRILREGTVFEWPVLTEAREWKAEIEMQTLDGRDVTVVTVLRHGDRLVVVTVM